jgi:beta-lactamase class A
MRSIRFIESYAEGGMVNVTTPRDVGHLFQLVRDDALGSPITSWRFKQLLSARVINDRLPALLPPGTEVVHKTGNLPGVLHDAGIIGTPGGSVVAVVMAQAMTDFDQTLSIEQRIGLLAYSIGAASRPSGRD